MTGPRRFMTAPVTYTTAKEHVDHLEFMLHTQDLTDDGLNDEGVCLECDAHPRTNDEDPHDDHGFCINRELAIALKQAKAIATTRQKNVHIALDAYRAEFTRVGDHAQARQVALKAATGSQGGLSPSLPVTVLVNNRAFPLRERRVNYADAIAMAGYGPSDAAAGTLTVVWHTKNNIGGTLTKGSDPITVQDGTIIDVADTSNA